MGVNQGFRGGLKGVQRGSIKGLEGGVEGYLVKAGEGGEERAIGRPPHHDQRRVPYTRRRVDVSPRVRRQAQHVVVVLSEEALPA
eukprot:912220-Prorocentrum_minimum.AAC.3